MSTQAPEPYVPREFEPIRTERLLMRVMTLDDVDDVHAYMSDPEVCRYLLFEPRSRETVTQKLTEWSGMGRLAENGDALEVALELLEGPSKGRVIGHSYFKLARIEDLSGEIGWTLNPEFERRGYASESASAMLDYAFGTLGLHRVYAELDPRNTASVALCGRLGMREEGHFREDMWLKGEWSDTGIHGILASEWNARR
jgi:RimJ/RimL family protein N-acetyltransferase